MIKKNFFLFLVKFVEQENICSNSNTELEYFRESFNKESNATWSIFSDFKESNDLV